MAYAATTDVPFERSIADIVGLLKKVGAERIAQVDEPERFTIQFELAARLVRFRVPYPSSIDVAAQTGPRQDEARVAAQLHRQRGRALLLVIKAKLESIESGVETFEQAFLANVVMANGETVYDRIAEPIAREYETGAPALLLTGPSE